MKERQLMPTIEDIKSWRGHDARGSEGDKLGTIEDIYLDRETGKPERMAVETGLVGGHMSFVPLVEARLHGDPVAVPRDQTKGKHARHAHADRRIPQQAGADTSDHGPRRAGPAGGSATRGYGF
jgi:sporulation protein YlmC with PRC-barrel domain